jgi:hypothetical protein
MLRANFEIHKTKRPCAFKAQGRLVLKTTNNRSAARLAAGNTRKVNTLKISSYFYLTTN